LNLIGPELVGDLVTLIQQAESDDAVRVVVFKSADPDYFIAHVDLNRVAEYRDSAAKLAGEPSLGLLFRYLSASRLITIAQIEYFSAILGPSGVFQRERLAYDEAALEPERFNDF